MENFFCNANGIVSSAKAHYGLVLAYGVRASESLENEESGLCRWKACCRTSTAEVP